VEKRKKADQGAPPFITTVIGGLARRAYDVVMMRRLLCTLRFSTVMAVYNRFRRAGCEANQGFGALLRCSRL
jgi:hypothetical protein